MNDPTAQMMSQHQHQQPPSQQMLNQNLPQMMNPVQHQPQQQMNPVQHQPQQQMMMNQPLTLPPQGMNRSYGMWGPPPQMSQPSMDQMKFQKHPPNPNLKAALGGGGFGSGKQGSKSLGPRNNWKGKRVKDGRRKDGVNMDLAGGSSVGGGYQPPTLNELQHQNRVKARRFFPKKYNPHYHTNYSSNNNGGRNMGKFAPRNTTSFLIRAKKSGGIAELVSPYPVTPAVLPTPMFSPSREVLVDMAKEEWGVDGYGSMKGLIRLRSPGREDEGDDDDEDEGESSDSDVEDHVEVERRLDHDLSRFEMIYPSNAGGMDYNNVLENRVDDQDTHIAHLEDENLILKERLFLMERELGDLRRRLQHLERHDHGRGEDIHEEILENESDGESESQGESRSMGINHEEIVEDNTEGHRDVKMAEEFEDDINMSKANDENVTKKDDQSSELMNEILVKDVAGKYKADIGNRKEGMLDKRIEYEADASLNMSIELVSKNDRDNDERPTEREVANCNDENVTKKYDQASQLMGGTVVKDVLIEDETDIENCKEEKIVNELRSAEDAGLDMSSMGGESNDVADNDAIPGENASNE